MSREPCKIIGLSRDTLYRYKASIGNGEIADLIFVEMV